MKFFFIFSVFLGVSSASAQNLNIQKTEAIERQREADRREEANRAEALKPNEKYTPTTVDTSKWGLDPNLTFEITNHLLGYSTIVESDRTLTGVKITGLINFAYYNTTEKSATGRSKSRYVFGGEFPLEKLSSRWTLWGGLGLTMGDVMAAYGDLGLELYITSWFKIQGGGNLNSARGLNPQVSLGLVW